jgi:DNA-binding LytR/AlgR family response regulator
MEGVRVIIAEDEPLIVADLENQLKKAGVHVLASFESGEEVLQHLSNDQPDILLLDIQLYGDLDGIDTAHQVNKLYNIPVIFLTSNTDKHTFNRAKLTFPHSFLSKPFRIKDILHSIELALELDDDFEPKHIESLSLNDRIFVRERDYLYKVLFKDILYIEADGAYTRIITREKSYTISQTLKKIEEKLHSTSLIRIHRSFVINIEHVDRLSENHVHIDKHMIPISRSQKDRVSSIFDSI